MLKAIRCVYVHNNTGLQISQSRAWVPNNSQQNKSSTSLSIWYNYFMPKEAGSGAFCHLKDRTDQIHLTQSTWVRWTNHRIESSMQLRSTDRDFPRGAQPQHGHSLQWRSTHEYSLGCQRNPFLEVVIAESHIIVPAALQRTNKRESLNFHQKPNARGFS